MLRQIYNIYKNHLYSIFYKDKKISNKFIIVSMGRTGSTLLTDLLNSHKKIYCDSEIFMRKHHTKLFFPMMYLKGITYIKTKQKQKKIYGFKVKEEQLSRENKINSEKFLQKLNNKGWKIIRLVRINKLKLALSIYKAWEDGIYEVKKGITYGKKYSLDVDIKKIKSILEYQKDIFEQESKSLQYIPYIEIVYENDLLNETEHQKTADIIFDYLGLKSEKVQTKFKKKSSDNIEKIVSNYNELFNELKDTEYGQYFN